MKFWISEDSHGPLQVWQAPQANHMYVLGVDACEGRTSVGDNAVIQVLDAETWEQCAVWCDRVDPDELAQILFDLYRWYNEAFVVLEVQGGGQEVARLIGQMGVWNRYRRREWDKVGSQFVLKWDWKTSSKSRPMMVAALRRAIRTRRVLLHCADTIGELMDWTRLDTARGGTKEGPASHDGHDDRVTALGLAIQGVQLDEARDEGETDDQSDMVTQQSGRWKGQQKEPALAGDGWGAHW